MKTALIDINIVLDVLLNREPHLNASAAVWEAIESHKARGLLSAHAITTIYYLLGREGGAAKAKQIAGALLSVFGIAAVDQSVIRSALAFTGNDFEDAVTAAAAEGAGCDFIVTRDPKGFRGSPVKAVTPETAIHLFVHVI